MKGGLSPLVYMPRGRWRLLLALCLIAGLVVGYLLFSYWDYLFTQGGDIKVRGTFSEEVVGIGLAEIILVTVLGLVSCLETSVKAGTAVLVLIGFSTLMSLFLAPEEPLLMVAIVIVPVYAVLLIVLLFIRSLPWPRFPSLLCLSLGMACAPASFALGAMILA